MAVGGDNAKDLEYIENCIKAALNSEPEISEDLQISAVKSKTRANGKNKDKDIEYEETLINIKDCYKVFRPMVEKAVITATRELAERQNNMESNLMTEIVSLRKDVKHTKGIMTDKLIDAKIRDDALEMYNRRDSVRIYGIPQSEDEKTNSGVTINKVMDVIKEIDLENVVNKADISACHRIHRKNKENNNPDPVMLKFVSRQMKYRVVANGPKLKNNTSTTKKYINEDLTPLRSRLLTYIKTKIPTVISKSVHSREGRILCKKEEDQTKWIFIESVRDLRHLNINITPELLKELDMDNCLIEDINT